LCLGVLLTHCVSAPDDATHTPTGQQATASVTGTSKSKLIPDNAVTPGFTDLVIDLMTVDDVIARQTDVTPGGAASLGQMVLQTASPQCEVMGCQWVMPNVPMSSSTRGLMSVVSDGRALPVWHPTYAMVINSNQMLDHSGTNAAMRTFAPSYVLAEAAIQNLAQLLGTDGNTLVARGVCLGLVWSERGEGKGIGTGFAGAAIELGSTGGTPPDLYYLNDTMNVLTETGTNRDGVFVLVGPDLSQPGAVVPTTFAVPVTVTRALSAGVFENNFAIVRPGIVTVVPQIPRR